MEEDNYIHLITLAFKKHEAQESESNLENPLYFQKPHN